MKTMRSVRAKDTILKSKDNNARLPSHFSTSSFTIVAFGNFDKTDRNSLSGMRMTLLLNRFQ